MRLSSALIVSIALALTACSSDNDNKRQARQSLPVISEADFYFDKHTTPYKEQIIATVKRLQREHSGCRDISPGSVAKSSSKGSAADPVFFVMCGKGSNITNVFFSKSDMDKQASIVAKKHYGETKSIYQCKDAAIARASNPSTVDFSTLLNAATKEIGGGKTIVQSSFTAKNSYGMELKYDIQCIVDHAGKVIDVKMNQAKG